MNKSPHNPIIVALDLPDREKAIQFATLMQQKLQWVKVGMRLYYAAGPDVVLQLKAMGFSVFLDLKLHDIPNTVAEAVDSLVQSVQPNWLTVHASGGHKMLEQAQNGAAESNTQLVAVTCLTSLSESDLQNIYPGLRYDAADWVCHLAEIAVNAGITHLVCSPHEAALLRKKFGQDVILITPGVRPNLNSEDDQTRIMTPQQALDAGANYLVIGRPILKASHPVEALHNINEQIAHIGIPLRTPETT